MSEACIQAVRIKLSRTSYEQLNKPVIHDVIKSITLYCQSSTQNSKSTGYPYLNKLYVRKLSSSPFLYFLLTKFLWKFQSSFAYLVRQCCFLCFFLILRGKVASGRLKLILSCMHNFRTAVLHWDNQMNKVLNGDRKRRQNFLSFSFSIII